ncbi:DUF7333 family protein [Halopiger thermotolerans]
MELNGRQTVLGLFATIGILVALFSASPMPTYAVLIVLASFLSFGAIVFTLGVMYGTYRGRTARASLE